MSRLPLPSDGAQAAPYPFRFLPSEVQEMEARLQPLQNPSASRFSLEELAGKFSASAERIGKVVIQPKQVRALVVPPGIEIPHLKTEYEVSNPIHSDLGVGNMPKRQYDCIGVQIEFNMIESESK
ncbi:unnamed protein product [Urochloa humidicola]